MFRVVARPFPVHAAIFATKFAAFAREGSLHEKRTVGVEVAKVNYLVRWSATTFPITFRLAR